MKPSDDRREGGCPATCARTGLAVSTRGGRSSTRRKDESVDEGGGEAGHGGVGSSVHAVLLLEQSRDLAEVASIRDMVLAAETYARAQRLADEAVRYATEVRVRAGELLAEHRASGPLPRP